jgi:hypothetical protein
MIISGGHLNILSHKLEEAYAIPFNYFFIYLYKIWRQKSEYFIG